MSVDLQNLNSEKDISNISNISNVSNVNDKEWRQTRISGGWLVNSETYLLFSTDSRCIITAAEATIRIYSIQTGVLVGNLVGHNGRITAVVKNPFNPLQLYSSSLDGTIKLWDTMDGVLLSTWDVGFPVTKMIADPVRRSVLYTFSKIQTHSYGTNKAPSQYQYYIHKMDFSNDDEKKNKTIITQYTDNLKNEYNSFLVDPKGEYLANQSKFKIIFYDLSTLKRHNKYILVNSQI